MARIVLHTESPSTLPPSVALAGGYRRSLPLSPHPRPIWNTTGIQCPTLVQNQAWTQIIISPILYNSIFGLNPNKGVASIGEAERGAGRATDLGPTNGPTRAVMIQHGRSRRDFGSTRSWGGIAESHRTLVERTISTNKAVFLNTMMNDVSIAGIPTQKEI